jgi:hypothetical protein
LENRIHILGWPPSGWLTFAVKFGMIFFSLLSASPLVNPSHPFFSAGGFFGGGS